MEHRRRSSLSQRLLVALALLTILSGALSVIVRTETGSGPTTGVVDPANLAALALIAAPSVAAVVVTRRWRILAAECVLALAGWLPLVGPAGDTSCVDCAFVLLLPLSVAGVQWSLIAVAWFFPGLRRG